MHLIGRLLKNHFQDIELGGVAQTGEMLKRDLRVDGEAVELGNHQIHNVVREALGADPIQVPAP